MTKQQLLAMFNLRQLLPLNNRLNNQSNLIPSAVLIPLVERKGQLFILLTQRSASLRHHPSQVSFPGGKVDQQELSVRHTALRETDEELGISADQISIFGQFPSHHTITGFKVTPFIGFVDPNYQATINLAEVTTLFELPLSELMNNPQHFSINIKRENIEHQVFFKPTRGWPIWGITAAILEQLKGVLNH